MLNTDPFVGSIHLGGNESKKVTDFSRKVRKRFMLVVNIWFLDRVFASFCLANTFSSKKRFVLLLRHYSDMIDNDKTYLRSDDFVRRYFFILFFDLSVLCHIRADQSR